MALKQNVFGFNHISKKLTPEEVGFLKTLYCRYHQKMWCYKKAHQTFKNRDLLLSATSAVITAGGLAGTAVFLPAVAIGACGIVLGVIGKKKNYSRKVELTRFAYTSYEKVLNKLRAALRGKPFEEDKLIHELHILDDNIIDLCPVLDFAKYRKKYGKSFPHN